MQTRALVVAIGLGDGSSSCACRHLALSSQAPGLPHNMPLCSRSEPGCELGMLPAGFPWGY